MGQESITPDGKTSSEFDGSRKSVELSEQSAKNQDTSKSRSEQAKFERQVIRDIRRGRLSERTKGALTQKSLEDFARLISQDKKTRDLLQDAIEQGRFRGRSTQVEVEEQILNPLKEDIADQSPPTVPKDLPSVIFTVCYQGQPAEFRLYGGLEKIL